MRVRSAISSRGVSTALAALVCAAPALSQDRELDFLTGDVDVAAGIATISLPAGWSYLQQADARFIVEDQWGNPPDETVVGLVVPPERPDGTMPEWAIIVSYEKDGYVRDDDAADIDFDDLLSSMKADSDAINAERRSAGYPTVDFLGWAEAPHYDSAGKKLYWAKSLRFEGEPATTLNYNVRILGRRGVLLMNAVADVRELTAVAAGSKEILAVTEFTPGNRYSEFDPSIDKVAAYGIGGLIAGKVLLKTGLFKVLLKPLIIVLVLVGAGLAKLFGGRRRAEPA